MDGFDEQKYIRNQNILSDYEQITISTDTGNPTVMDYDGIISWSGQTEPYYYVNGVVIAHNEWGNYSGVQQQSTLFVNKGDRVCITKVNAYMFARFYKLRDYSRR